MAKRVRSKKVVNNTPYYEEVEDRQIFVLKEAFTFGIDSRENNPVFPYVISLSLKNNPETLSELKSLKKKFKVTEKLFYGADEDMIYISLMDISMTQRETLFRQRGYVKAKIEFNQITHKGENVYMNLSLLAVKKVRDVARQVADDYSSDSE